MRSNGKRLLPAVVVLLAMSVMAAAVLSGCGTSNSNKSKQYRITLLTGDNHDPFFMTMIAGAKMEAKKLGVKFTWQGPADYNPQEQIPVLDAVMATKPDFLIAVPTDVNALVAPLRAVKNGGTPILFIDETVRDTSIPLGLLASNNLLGGEIAAQQLAKQLPAGSKVAYVGEQRGVFSTDQREEGFAAELKKTKLVFVGAQYGADDPNTAATLTSALLTRYPDLKGVFGSDTAWQGQDHRLRRRAGRGPGSQARPRLDVDRPEVLRRGRQGYRVCGRIPQERHEAAQIVDADLRARHEGQLQLSERRQVPLPHQLTRDTPQGRLTVSRPWGPS